MYVMCASPSAADWPVQIRVSGEGRYMLINVYVFIFLMGESIAPCAWAGVGLVVSPVEEVKGQT